MWRFDCAANASFNGAWRESLTHALRFGMLSKICDSFLLQSGAMNFRARSIKDSLPALVEQTCGGPSQA
jgi:hypothetical protein